MQCPRIEKITLNLYVSTWDLYIICAPQNFHVFIHLSTSIITSSYFKTPLPQREITRNISMFWVNYNFVDWIWWVGKRRGAKKNKSLLLYVIWHMQMHCFYGKKQYPKVVWEMPKWRWPSTIFWKVWYIMRLIKQCNGQGQPG